MLFVRQAAATWRRKSSTRQVRAPGSFVYTDVNGEENMSRVAKITVFFWINKELRNNPGFVFESAE